MLTFCNIAGSWVWEIFDNRTLLLPLRIQQEYRNDCATIQIINLSSAMIDGLRKLRIQQDWRWILRVSKCHKLYVSVSQSWCLDGFSGWRKHLWGRGVTDGTHVCSLRSSFDCRSEQRRDYLSNVPQNVSQPRQSSGNRMHSLNTTHCKWLNISSAAELTTPNTTVQKQWVWLTEAEHYALSKIHFGYSDCICVLTVQGYPCSPKSKAIIRYGFSY